MICTYEVPHITTKRLRLQPAARSSEQKQYSAVQKLNQEPKLDGERVGECSPSLRFVLQQQICSFSPVVFKHGLQPFVRPLLRALVPSPSPSPSPIRTRAQAATRRPGRQHERALRARPGAPPPVACLVVPHVERACTRTIVRVFSGVKWNLWMCTGHVATALSFI